MESKPKTRQVRKVSSAQDSKNNKPKNPDNLIRYNGELVESLFSSEAWTDIAFPLLQESIASVSGRFTNGRFYQGTLTRLGSSLDKLSGYQLALEEFYNRLNDFILAKNKLIEDKKEKALDAKAPIYNPFMEDENNEE